MIITYDTNKYPFVLVNIQDGEDQDNILYESFMQYLEKQYKEKIFLHIISNGKLIYT